MQASDIVALMSLARVSGGGESAPRQALRAAGFLGIPVTRLIRTPAEKWINRLPAGDCRALVAALNRRTEHRPLHEERLLERLRALGARVFVSKEAGYPRALETCLGDRAPTLVTYAGPPELLRQPAAAVLGARDVTRRGALIAEACARMLAARRIPIVSGGARGVDMIAHLAALDSGGRTLIVLPQGLLHYRVPREVLAALEQEQVGILSEFLPDAPWQTYAAIKRNGTISALARMVCVIEPNRAGGSVRTAHCALEQGKPVLFERHRRFQLVADDLVRLGAEPLCDAEGRVDEKRLLNRWKTRPDRAARQEELW